MRHVPRLTLAVAALILVGCETNSPIAPPGHETVPKLQRPGTLVGRVTDAAGQPLPGAIVNFGYTVLAGTDTIGRPPDPAPRPGVEAVISPDSMEVTIDDFRGRPVNHLFYTAEDQGGVLWDGTDATGARVPDGPYRLHLTAWKDGEVSRFESWLLVGWNAPESRVAVVAARADERGRFSMNLADLPLWSTYPVTLALPSGVDSLVTHYDPRVYVYAYRGDGSLTHARQSVRIEDEDGRYRVDLRLPE
jgi:hypothetical protein